MIYAINYANEKYRKSQILNSQTALMHGVDKVIEYSPRDIDSNFYNINREILNCERGNGYWLWKPYFIKKTLEDINDNDYLIYSDAGSYYINDIDLLISCAKKENTDIMVFSLSEKAIERIWSKRDAFILMECDSTEYVNSPQRLAGFLLLKKTVFSYKFVTEWLIYAQDIRIVSDQPNCLGKENYLGFRENRHDQTVLSLLSKKYHISSFRDPSTLKEKDVQNIEQQSDYPQIFQLHRMGDISTIEELESRYNGWLGELREVWKHDKRKILYGAGKNAKKFILYAKANNIEIDGCVVSDNQNVKDNVKEGIAVYHISEMPYPISEVVIIVTISSAEVIEWLKGKNYYFFLVNKRCWSALNYFEMKRERGECI